MKDRIKDLLSFSRKEQRGLMILLGLMLCILFSHYFLAKLIPQRQFDPEPFLKQIEAFEAAIASADSAEQLEAQKKILSSNAPDVPDLSTFLANPFMFDPNVLDEESWRKTGLDERTIRSILRYRQKGGKFKDKNDLQKIYSMNDSVFRLLEPYIQIEIPQKRPFKKDDKKEFKNNEQIDRKLESEYQTIDLNTADSALLTELPGIGPYYASRIIKYRYALGGFYEKQQLLEVKGIDSACFVKIKDRVVVTPDSICKMDLNTIEFKELLRHPYFEYYLVKSIFNYRDRVKRIDSIGQLKNLEVMYDELYEKIAPYLVAE